MMVQRIACPPSPMQILKAFALFAVTAVAEIMGCYLPYLWLKKNGSPWLLIPALLSLMLRSHMDWVSRFATPFAAPAVGPD